MKILKKITNLALFGIFFLVGQSAFAADDIWCLPTGGNTCSKLAPDFCLTGQKFATEAECTAGFKWCVTGVGVCEKTKTCDGKHFDVESECKTRSNQSCIMVQPTASGDTCSAYNATECATGDKPCKLQLGVPPKCTVDLTKVTALCNSGNTGTKFCDPKHCQWGIESSGGGSGTAADSTIQPTTGGKGTIIELVNPIGGSDANPKGVTSLFAIVGGVLKALMGILGSGALLVFIYGGFLWVTAAGNAENVSTGAAAMTWAAIGICVIFSSYAIISLLFSTLTAGGGSNTDTNAQTGDVWCLGKQNVCEAMPASQCSGDTFPSQGECQNAVNFVGPPQSE